MSVLRLNVLGPPEVYHDGSRLTFALRKAQALLLYLAVEGGMHPRSKLAALLWPDSEPHAARTALRNALTLLRSLLATPDASASPHSHLLSQQDLLGLDPHAPFELDLDVVQQAYHQAQRLSTFPSQEPRAALVTQVQQALALVRGPFLEGFWLREETGFDEWVRQQQQQWQVRLPLLLDRLSSWQESGGELEPARATLTRWLALDPLSEEASRRLMRMNLALGDASAALQVYATLRAHLAEELRVQPSAETVALADQIRASAAASRGSTPARRAAVESRPPSELTAPLVEALRPRLEAENAPEDLLDDVWLTELARLLPELRGRYPDLPAPTQDELSAKMRLFEAVARLVDALAKPAPLVLLLDDLHWVDGASLDLLRYLGRHWKGHGSPVLLLCTLRREGLEPRSQLADLGRDLPISQVALQMLSQAQTFQLLEALIGEQEESTSSGGEPREHSPVRPSSAGPEAHPWPEQERPLVRLGHVLFAQTGGQPLYLLETLKLWRERQWLLPKLGADGSWKLEPTQDLAAALSQDQPRRKLVPPSVRELIQGRLAKLTQLARQLVRASAVLGTQASAKLLWQVAEVEVQTGVEALEEAIGSGMLREVVYTELGAARRQVLHQRALVCLQTEGTAAAELAYHARASGETEAAYGYSVQAGMEAVAVFAVADAIGYYEQARAWLQERQGRQSRLAASEVERLYVHLGQAYVFQNDWEQAQEAYEELLAYAKQHQLAALASMTLNRLAILAIQQSNGKPTVRALLDEAWHIAEGSHDQKALAETAWNLAQITGIMWEDLTSSLRHGELALSLARARHDQELEARCLYILGVISLYRGDVEGTTHYVETSLALYATIRTEPTFSGELSLPHFVSGAPLTQALTHRTSEAWCWGLLALTQVYAGQVLGSIHSGRRALALSTESKNGWAQVLSTAYLTYGLLDAGAFEEALELMQAAMALARTLPPMLSFQRLLTALGMTYHAVQQWEEARSTLEEAEAVAETLDLARLRVVTLSQLCMNCALTGEWEQAHTYAVQAMALRESIDRAMIPLDFSFHYETEALLRGGDERQARVEVQRLGERLGSNRRFRLPYLRSEALLSAWDGESEQAIGHLREAAWLAADLGLPGERWQIQAALGSLYEAAGDPVQARTAFGEAATIIGGLAEGIKDEALRSRFLAGPPIQQVVQQAHRLANQVPQDQAEPSGAPRRVVLQTDESWEAS